ncbi:carboxylesterase [Peniophora sp. CONT]|nr:carboxylesterase [Peniophora sp. CONT]
MRVSALLVTVLSVASRTAASITQTVLFASSGDWTTRGSAPSALLLTSIPSNTSSTTACATLNETLLPCNELPAFEHELAYQASVDTIASANAVRSACSSQKQDASAVLCTNSAPYTTAIFTDFTDYPRTTVSSANHTTFTGLRDHLGFRFMGISYALPPVGERRFALAEKAEEGVEVDATVFRPACLQFGSFAGNSSGLNPWGNDEDCLHLNVFTPHIPDAAALQKNELKPVMLWIHGGDNINGAGSDSTFDGGALAQRADAVIVTINYRLNIFGYLALPNATDNLVRGNFALSDKIIALEWVQRHIEAFGGNKGRVTVFGQSAGGWSTIDLIKSPRARGLFARAIVHSGGAGNVAAQSVVEDEALPSLSALCPSTSGAALLACLRSLDAQTLLNITQSAGNWPSVVDGDFVPDFALKQLALGPGKEDSVLPIQYMAGFMPDEGQSLMGSVVSPNVSSFPDALATMVKSFTISQPLADAVLASGLWNTSDTFSPYNASQSVDTDHFLTCDGVAWTGAAASHKVFPEMYIYSIKRAYGLPFFDPFDLCTFPVGEEGTPYYKCHSGELFETFGTFNFFDLPPRSDADIHFTNLIQDLWGSFARTGNPNPSHAYLSTRGFTSTLSVVSDWTWPRFDVAWAAHPEDGEGEVLGSGEGGVAALDWPKPGEEGLPDVEKCEVVLGVEPVM